MNLWQPGSCDFSGAILKTRPISKNIYGKQIQHKIDLDGHYFESALYEQDVYAWLKFPPVNLEVMLAWFNNACPRFQMIPQNPAAKSIYALQHLSRSEYGPPSIIWIFYALETLFDCKPGENFKTLNNRIANLLKLSAKEHKVLKTNLRNLYDIRSAFVHGGLEVVHPLRDEGLDKRADNASWRFVPPTDFGVALILRCLNELMIRGWLFPTFEERMSGVSA